MSASTSLTTNSGVFKPEGTEIPKQHLCPNKKHLESQINLTRKKKITFCRAVKTRPKRQSKHTTILIKFLLWAVLTEILKDTMRSPVLWLPSDSQLQGTKTLSKQRTVGKPRWRESHRNKRQCVGARWRGRQSQTTFGDILLPRHYNQTYRRSPAPTKTRQLNATVQVGPGCATALIFFSYMPECMRGKRGMTSISAHIYFKLQV